MNQFQVPRILTLQNASSIDTSFLLRPRPQIRGSLKSWTKLWCVLKPGLLLIYRSQKAKVCPHCYPFQLPKAKRTLVVR